MHRRRITFLLLAILTSCARVPTAPPAAPSTHIIDLEGRPAAPLAPADPARRATVLLFITNDCPISNAFAPEIHRLCDAYTHQGIAFYLVYSDPSLAAADARKHYTDFGYRCAAVLDPKHELAQAAGATITPEAAVFLPSGQLIYRGRINNWYSDYGKSRYAPTTHDLKDVCESVAQNKPIEPKFTQAIGCHIPT
jgi:hypothetical protein